MGLICIILVVAYFLIGNSHLPPEIYHSNWYILLGVVYPGILFYVLAAILSVLKRKGIIKSPPPKSSSSTNNSVLTPTEEIPVEAISPATMEVIPPPPPPTPRQPTVDEMLHSVDLLDGLGFERWCAQILEKGGFSDIQLTKASGDQGVDIIATKSEIWYAFQCKCYSSDLGNHPVQEVHAGKSLYRCHVGVVMTNRHFTSGAKELAEATGVLLWDRDKLKSMILDYFECVETEHKAVKD